MGWTSCRSWLFEDLCQRFSVHMRQRCHHCTGPGHPLCSLLTATHLKHPKTIAACWKPICNTSKISENNRKQAKRTAGYTLIGNTFETRPYFQKQLETRLMITDGFAGWSKIKLDFYVSVSFQGWCCCCIRIAKTIGIFLNNHKEGISKDKQQICGQAYFIGRVKKNKPHLL